MFGITVGFHLMETGKKFIHLSNDLSFVGEVNIVVRIWYQDDTRARHAAPEGIGPGRTACSVVGNQSGFAVRLVGRKAVPVVRIYIASAGTGMLVYFCAPKLRAASIGERGGNGGMFATSALF
jgi:hypothetical protein